MNSEEVKSVFGVEQKGKSRPKKGRPGEAKIHYRDGNVERVLRGKIIKKDEWGIEVLREDGLTSFGWESIIRMEERNINCHNCGEVVFWSMKDQSYFCYDCDTKVDP